jgi:hypothetical protein
MYTSEQSEKFNREHDEITAALQDLMFEGMSQAQSVDIESSRRHLLHGAGRRMGVLKKSLKQIFTLFPPSQQIPLQRELLTDVQIFLHAFVINVAGIFDNWAWAFLYRHGLTGEIGNPRNVGLFKKETRRYLPKLLKTYLESPEIASWHEEYAKGYRDSLAHRIPLYIPPASWTNEDAERYQQLEKEKIACIQAHEWKRLDEVWDEQDKVGKPCPVFLHDLSPESPSKPVYLHPQLLCDALTVVDFGKKFYASWHERSP